MNGRLKQKNTLFSNLSEKLDSLDLSRLEASTARGIVKILFQHLADSGQTFNFINYDFNNAFLVKTTWGYIVEVLSTPDIENEGQTVLNVFLRNDEEEGIVLSGYGGVAGDDKEGKLFFKIFPSQRAFLNSSQVLTDTIVASAITANNIPDILTVRPGQQFNPIIEANPTSAPIFYRKLGFYNTSPEEVYFKKKLENKKPLTEYELVFLAQKRLRMEIDDNTKQSIRAKGVQEKTNDSDQSVLIEFIENKKARRTQIVWNRSPRSVS